MEDKQEKMMFRASMGKAKFFAGPKDAEQQSEQNNIVSPSASWIDNNPYLFTIIMVVTITTLGDIIEFVLARL